MKASSLTVRFTLGENEYVRFNLPSRREGDSATFVGTIAVRLRDLRSSVHVQVSQRDLAKFLDDVERSAKDLHGKFQLAGLRGEFCLKVEMAPHGHVRVDLQLQESVLSHPEDLASEVKAHFGFPAASLTKTLREAGRMTQI